MNNQGPAPKSSLSSNNVDLSFDDQDAPQVLTGLVFSLPKNAAFEAWATHESASLAAESLKQSYASLSDLEWRLHYLARDLESAFPDRFRGEIL